MKSKFLIILLLFSTIGCSPKYPPSKGYVEACYGGNYSKVMTGLKPEYSAQLKIQQRHWPELLKQLKELSIAFNTKLFHDDREYGGLSMFNVSLCSEKGLYMYVDERIWDSSGDISIPKKPMSLNIFIYRKEYSGKQLIQSVKSTLSKRWGKLYKDDLDINTLLQLSY